MPAVTTERTKMPLQFLGLPCHDKKSKVTMEFVLLNKITTDTD
jgi:hypothetical protein